MLYTRREPYTEFKRQWDIPRHVVKGGRPVLPGHCPDSLGSLIERCWSHDPEDRYRPPSRNPTYPVLTPPPQNVRQAIDG